MCTFPCAFPVTCQNGAVSCGSWSFESNTVENWSYSSVDLSVSSIGASPVRAFVGSRSLAATFNTATVIHVPLCAGGIAANLVGRTIHARVFFDTGGATFVNQMRDDNQIYMNLTDGPAVNANQSRNVAQAFFDPITATPVQPNTWVNLQGVVASEAVAMNAAYLNIGILLDLPPEGFQGGTIYVDDVTIF